MLNLLKIYFDDILIFKFLDRKDGANLFIALRLLVYLLSIKIHVCTFVPSGNWSNLNVCKKTDIYQSTEIEIRELCMEKFNLKIVLDLTYDNFHIKHDIIRNIKGKTNLMIKLLLEKLVRCRFSPFGNLIIFYYLFHYLKRFCKLFGFSWTNRNVWILLFEWTKHYKY